MPFSAPKFTNGQGGGAGDLFEEDEAVRDRPAQQPGRTGSIGTLPEANANHNSEWKQIRDNRQTSSFAVMSHKKRIPVNGGQSLSQNPFVGLKSDGLPPAPGDATAEPVDHSTAESVVSRKNRGRVDIIRQTAGRGGKTVTVISGFVGISLIEKEQLARAMQKACGTGGTVKDGRIEIQGDQREVAARILTEAGFRPVFAGGTKPL
jgi:translation initiation factor 1